MRMNILVPILVLLGCAGSSTGGSTDPEDSATPTVPVATETSGVELSPELCEDPSILQTIFDSFEDPDASESPGLGLNEDQIPALVASPTETFYMVNLIQYRAQAEYADGRQTDLTGREANALYDPFPYIDAIGARIVYESAVDDQIAGADDVAWDDIIIVEYPCAIAFLAMVVDPGFTATSVHKDAGVQTTRVMFAELQPVPAPEDPDQSEATYAPTAEDPAFDLMHVMDFHDTAQYEDGADEQKRTGEEAWNLYQSGANGVSRALGHYSTAFFKVNGTLIGDNTGWDEIQMVHMSSQAGFQALLDDDSRQGVRYHRLAALADNDSMILFPTTSAIPYSDVGSTPLEVTPNGTGTPCQDVEDCPDDSFICVSSGGAGGFCSPQSCTPGECEGSYACCHDCNPALASELPFEESTCIPEDFTAALTNAPVSCTCD